MSPRAIVIAVVLLGAGCFIVTVLAFACAYLCWVIWSVFYDDKGWYCASVFLG